MWREGLKAKIFRVVWEQLAALRVRALLEWRKNISPSTFYGLEITTH